MNSFYSPDELSTLGLKSYGKNVLISRKTSLYSPEKMEFGNFVRIDDFCILSGNIKLGNYIHVSSHNTLMAGCYGIEMEDFSGFSSHCAAYAISDDYSGESLTNPMCPMKYRSLVGGKILIKRHAIIGTGSVLLPGVCIEEGSAIGAMSLVTKNIPPWSICTGTPCKVIKARSRKILELEKKLKEDDKWANKSWLLDEATR